MGIFDIFRKKEVRSEALAEPVITDAGALLTALRGNTGLSKNQVLMIPTVEGCLSLIKGAVRGIPIKLYEYGEGGAINEVKGDRRTYMLNVDPGDTLNATQMMDAVIDDYFLLGSARVFINGIGDIRSLHYVDGERISVYTNQEAIFKDYSINVDGKEYRPFEFLKILRETKDGAEGFGIISRNSLVLETAYNSFVFENNLVKNGGSKRGFIKSPRKIAKEAIEKLKEAWKRLYSNNNENIIILNEGLEFQEASATSTELQLNENKKSNAEEIIKMFNIPPGMLAGASTSQTSEDDKTKFADYCIIPFLTVLKNALNRDLLYEDEKEIRFFDFDITELKKGTLLDRMRAYKLGIETNVMQVDECRKIENRPALGYKLINLSLGNVLYNPETDRVFVPNTGESYSMAEFMKKGEGENED